MTTPRATRLAAIVAVCAVLTDIRVPFAAEPLFLEVAADVGLKFTHVNGAAGQYDMPEQMGRVQRSSTTTTMAIWMCFSCREARSTRRPRSR